MIRFGLLAFVFALFVLGCPPPSVLHEPPYTETETDAGDYPAPPNFVVEEFPEDSPAALASPCGKACENLRRIGCREGFPTSEGITCYSGCLSMARHALVPTRCWSTRTSPESVRECGSIRCLPPAKISSPN